MKRRFRAVAMASEDFVDELLAAAATGRKAGLRYGPLWVSGPATRQAAVCDRETGDRIVALTRATAPSFIDDVVGHS